MLTIMTHEELLKLVSYNPDTGEFIRACDRRGYKAGTSCGSVDKYGRIVVWIGSKRMLGHQVAWFYMTGSLASHQIRHIDGDRSNNRWDNLTKTSVDDRRPSGKKLNADMLRDMVSYDPDTGIITSNQSRGCRAKGTPIGTKGKTGHMYAGIDGRIYLIHRLIWMYMTGDFPKKGIDHINGDPTDNRWINLREATQAENVQNIRKATRVSTTKLLGSFKTPNGKYCARIRSNKKLINLGTFASAEEAHAAYVAAKRVIHSFCTI